MQLTFSPALGENAPLVVRLARPDVVLDVLFKATFDSSASYEHAKSHGVRVEMWTDLPVEGRGPGKWGAVPFTFEPSQNGAPGEHRKVVSLPSPVDEGVMDDERRTVCAKVALRLGNLTANQRFSFTYRLVHASGDIRWLGAFGHDGTLVVKAAPLPAALGIELDEGWQTQEDGVATFTGGSSQRQEVGRILDSSAWHVWALGRDSWPMFSRASDMKPCSAMVLTSRSLGATLVQQSPVVLTASSGASISVETDGRVVYCSDNDAVDLALRVMDDTRFVALSDCDVQIRLLGSGLNLASARIVACHAPGAALPLSILVLPSENGRVSHYVPLDVHALAPALPDSAFRSFVVTTSNKEDFWVSSEDDQTTVRVGAFGGVAFVAPLYDLVTPEAGSEHSWQVAVLQPHTDAKVTTVEELVEVVPQRLLPTPPPSPPITMRVAQRPPSLSLPSFTQAWGVPGSAHSSASSTAVSTPVAESTSALPKSTTHVRPPTPYPINHPRAKADELAVMRVHNINPLSSYVAMLLAISAWIWRVIFQRFGLIWLGAADVQVSETGAESDDCASTLHSLEHDAPDTQRMNDDGEGAGEDTLSDGAITPRPPTPVAAGGSIASPVAQPEPTVALPGTQTIKSRSALQVHVPGQSGKIVILVHAPEPTLLVADHLQFVLNGKVLPEHQSFATPHGNQLVRLDVPTDNVSTLTVALV